MSITDFLLARIAEDQAVARAALTGIHGEHKTSRDYADYVLSSERDTTEAQDEFIETFWPARVLAECAAKRAIVEAFDPKCPDLDPFVGRDVIAILAAVYADHQDYRDEWALSN